MSVVLLRLFYGIWLLGWAFLMLKALSMALFSRFPDRGRRLLHALLLAPFWPLALFSGQGRSALRRVFFYRGEVE